VWWVLRWIGFDRVELVLCQRWGRIPGAINVPSSSLADQSGRYRQWNELEILFDQDRDRPALYYCGGGGASSNGFIMTRLGYNDVAVHMGSLEEWAADFDLPMEPETH
jgi:thiosulfate/3-mercaptopyruvate sulfurtransferase